MVVCASDRKDQKVTGVGVAGGEGQALVLQSPGCRLLTLGFQRSHTANNSVNSPRTYYIENTNMKIFSSLNKEIVRHFIIFVIKWLRILNLYYKQPRFCFAPKLANSVCSRLI